MGLHGQAALQWNKILANIKNIGICRTGSWDYLTWKGKRRTNSIGVADTYLSLSRIPPSQSSWQFPTALWKIGIPRKIIIFSWLVVHNKNLIWENLQKRQWQGSSICSIRNAEVENNEHIFLQCKLTTQVWKNLSNFFWLLFYNAFFHKGLTGTVECIEGFLETHSLIMYMDNLEMEEQFPVGKQERGVSTNRSQGYFIL